ncbi:MAG: Rossmann-like domain-containing protein [Gammaproteobacteria bacterium]
MEKPTRIYELLLDYAASDTQVTELIIGLVWTVCKAQHLGLAMSPGIPVRTLSWPGTVVGKTVGELAAWITDWEPYKATVAMAAINCSLNRFEIPAGITLLAAADKGNLAVFEHFLPQLKDKKVVVIGRYPGIECYAEEINLSILERQPVLNDYPDPACEFLLPDADWVFLTASSITNKTFPRLAELSQNAKTVLMGPTVPWLPQFHEFGIDYLAGLEVVDPIKLYQTAAEGGGVRIFENGARYRIVELTPDYSMTWLKNRIAQDYSEKQQLTLAMEQWYSGGKKGRFPEFNQLHQVTTRLSRMDSSYKCLWDISHEATS